MKYNKILSIIIIIALSTILAFAYNASDNLSLRLLEATDDIRPFREDFNYNFELVDDLFDDVSLIEYGYLDGVTSAIQTQLNAKIEATLTEEQVEDYAGGMWTGNTETFLTLTYQDADGTIDAVVPVKDEDNMASDSAVFLATQQSIKAYADTLHALQYLKTETDALTEWETIWSKDVLDTTELNTFAKLQALVADKTLVNEEDVFTIDANWVNTTNPWADNEVADNITIALATLATTFTVTDNENESLACPIVFVDGATGAQGAETDDTDFTYNPSTGTLKVTALDLTTALPDAEVANNITIDLATLATTITVTDNESTNENNPLCFVAGADPDGGSLGIETDGDLHYNPSTGILTAPEFVGGGTGLTGIEMELTDEASLYTTLSDVSLFLEDTIDDTSPELGGEMDAGAHSIGFTQQAVTGSDTTTTINWTLGNKFFFTFGAMNETLTFTDPSNPCNLLLVVKQDGSGSRTMTWPTILWAGGTAPTLTTAGNSIDIISFYFDGTNYYGVASLAFATP